MGKLITTTGCAARKPMGPTDRSDRTNGRRVEFPKVA